MQIKCLQFSLKFLDSRRGFRQTSVFWLSWSCFNGIRNLDAFWPSEVYLGAEICCWQFKVRSRPLTDSSAIPAVGPTASRGAMCARIQTLESPALGKGKAEATREGKSTTWGTVCRPCQPWMVTLTNCEGNVAAGRLCLRGSQCWGGEGCWALGWGMNSLSSAHQGIKRRSTMPEKFHHVSVIGFQVTDYHCWFLGLQGSSANGSIKS